MAKHHDPLPAGPTSEPKPPEGHPLSTEDSKKGPSALPGQTEKTEKGTHVVTFAGQAPVTVTAGDDEEAIRKAAEHLGVVCDAGGRPLSEKPPEVVKVTA